jgi:DNA-directed RNA polymerase sigma subunit (sigma70/sigma32)
MSETEKRGIRKQAIRELVEFLTANARNPEEVGRRVTAFRFLLSDDDVETQTDLAEKLGISRQRASVVVDTIYQKLSEIVEKPDGAVDRNEHRSK